MTRTSALCGLLVALAAWASPASAHGVIADTEPGRAERVPGVPPEIRVTLTEAPADGSRMRVIDGCGRSATGAVEVDGSDLIARTIGTAEPGPWRVQIRSISSVDGHTARASFGFRVAGQRDCAREEPPTDEGSPTTSSQPPIHNPNPPSDFPWIPIGLGSAALIAIALVLRGRGS